MDRNFESIYHTAEDHNWWFKTRQDFIYRYLMQNHCNAASTILDIGCGGGGLLNYLSEKKFTQTHGIDNSPQAIAFCTSRGLSNVVLDDAQQVRNFAPKSFDVIISSDVLEHLDQPLEAMKRWNELLKDTGTLIVFVPAFNALWSERDILNKHITRYTRRQLLTLAHDAGLKPVLQSYWNFFLFIPYFCALLLKKFAKNKIVTLKKEDTLLNRFLKKILGLENTMILKGFDFPFGVSFLAVLKKQS